MCCARKKNLVKVFNWRVDDEVALRPLKYFEASFPISSKDKQVRFICFSFANNTGNRYFLKKFDRLIDFMVIDKALERRILENLLPMLIRAESRNNFTKSMLNDIISICLNLFAFVLQFQIECSVPTRVSFLHYKISFLKIRKKLDLRILFVKEKHWIVSIIRKFFVSSFFQDQKFFLEIREENVL